MSQLDCDILIIGSGASAVHTALPLVEAGRDVLMVDVGITDDKKNKLIPKDDWKTNREKDEDQWRYFLGEDFEGIPMGPVRVGAQLTPARQHLHKKSDEIFPTKNHHFAAMQSTALGGLGTGWGASSMPFSGGDFKGWPIYESDFEAHYQAIADHIGMCGPDGDDLSDFLGATIPSQKPPRLDSNAESIMSRYEKKREYFNSMKFFLGHSRLAIRSGSKDKNGADRKLRYLDMEFWGDVDQSVYRPRKTLEELQKHSNFKFQNGLCVLVFKEEDDGVVLTLQDVQTKEIIQQKANTIFIAAGAINSAKIVLNSFEKYHEPLPLLSNPYTYFPSLNFPRIGQPTKDKRHSLTQLTMLYDHNGDGKHLVQPQLYSYRSLLLFKLIKESPLPTRESMKLFQAIQDYLVIIGVFHEDRHAKSKHLLLRKGESVDHNWLEIRYQRPESELNNQREKEAALCRIFRKLGILPLKRIFPGDGASIHYAGTLPMSLKAKEFTLDTNGKLHNTKRVYISDGSGFPHLPAKGLTMTLMANARRIACDFLSENP